MMWKRVMKREEDSHPVTLVVTTRFLVYCLHLCANKLDLDRSLEMYAFVGKYFAVLLSLNLLPINQQSFAQNPEEDVEIVSR